MLHELIAYVRWSAVLRQPADPDDRSKGSNKAWWQASAKRGNVDAIRKLDGPSFPEPLAYLYDWLQELHGRSGVNAHGFNPLTFTTIRDWAALTHRTVRPYEVDALIVLDAVMAHPEEKSDGS